MADLDERRPTPKIPRWAFFVGQAELAALIHAVKSHGDMGTWSRRTWQRGFAMADTPDRDGFLWKWIRGFRGYPPADNKWADRLAMAAELSTGKVPQATLG